MLRSVHQTPLSLWWFTTDGSGEREKRKRGRSERCIAKKEEEIWKLNRQRERKRDRGKWRWLERVRLRERGCWDCRECMLLCGRVSDCNDCSKVTGLICGRAPQSGSIAVQIPWIKLARLKSSPCLTLTAFKSGFHYVSLFYSICSYDCMYRARQQIATSYSEWGLIPNNMFTWTLIPCIWISLLGTN